MRHRVPSDIRRILRLVGLPLVRALMLLAVSALCGLLPPAFLMAWRASSSIRELAAGCALGLLLETALFALFTFHAAAFVERLYRIPMRSAIGFILRALFLPEWKYPVGEVRNGDLTPATRDSVLVRVGGPGALVVHESNLVLLERGGAFARLIGPGLQHLRPFERPALVLDLRPQSRRRQVNAWTRDGLPVRSTLYLSCRLRWQPNEPENEARLIRMAYQLDTGSREKGYGIDWAGELADEARAMLARRLGRLWFDELWSPYMAAMHAPPPAPQLLGEPSADAPTPEPWGIPERPPEDAPIPARWEEIRQEVRRELEQWIRGRQWEVEILHFAFEPPVPWPEVEPMIREAWLEHWRVPWRGWAVHLQSRAMREQVRQRELARAMGQRELLEAIVAVVQQEWPLGDPQRGLQRLLLRLVELMQHWSHPDAELLTPTDLFELVHHLRRMMQRPSSAGGSDAHGSPPPFPTDPGLE
ncbi:hypothetical protein HRbin22_01265 [Candidatus Thermoflexus japonica]|uniref:Band 7 domain-containing protein n=1 Tax=Candidatus Thermoflexus japonica TaxID=2035417 RepID=A0A2H5Y6P5_9CHLR|nr:hypothetical protein HRbin22_01265 [Candidatus Thermoflexus japonica]